MYKENLNGQEASINIPPHIAPENHQYFLTIQSCPLASEATRPLVKKAEKISLMPKSYEESSQLLPGLKKFFYAYQASLVPFAQIKQHQETEPGCFSLNGTREFLARQLSNHIINDLTEEQREIANEGKQLIGSLFPKESMGWSATYSFWFDYLKQLYPTEEIFKNKTNPFIISFNFTEGGALPRFDRKEFYLDIPILFKNGDGSNYFWGCWSPEKESNKIIKGHHLEEDCSCREKLANGELIIHNKNNAQEQFNFYRPGG